MPPWPETPAQGLPRRDLLAWLIRGGGASIGALVVEERSLRMNLERVSPLGCLATGPSAGRLSPGERCAVDLLLGPQCVRCVSAEVEAVHAERVWLGFRGLEVEQARALSEPGDGRPRSLPSSGGTAEVVTDADRIRSMCHALTANHCQGVLHTADGAVRVRGLATRPGQDLALLWEVSEEPREPGLLELHGPLSSFELPIRRHRFDGALATDLPEWVARTRRRRWQRTDVTGAEISFEHPLHRGLTVCAPLLNLSRGGVAFDAASVEQPLPVGLQLRNARIRVGNRRCLALVEVRHATGAVRGGRLRADDPAAWNELVGVRQHPGTRLEDGSSEGLWGLYADSNYFDLSGKSRQHFSTKRRDYQAAGKKLCSSPRLACKVVYTSRSGEYEAALTAARTYRHTWFGFHMAKRKGISEDGVAAREVLRRIHLRTYEHVLDDPDTRWVLGYVQHLPGLHFPRMIHVAFPEYCLPTGRSCVVSFRALQLESARAVRPLPGGYTVRRASSPDLDVVADVIARERPRPYVEALDFTRDRLRMSGIEADWSRAGMRRERQIFVASRGEETLAALVVESASDGVHLYDLLDCARLFALVEGGEDAFDALLELAREWFLDQGKPHFVYLQENGEFDASVGRDQVDLGTADLTVLSADLLPDFLEQIWEATSKRPATTPPASLE